MSREVRPEGQKKAKARLKGTGKSAAPSPLSNQPSQNMVMYHEAMSMKAKTARDKTYKTYLKLLAIDTSNIWGCREYSNGVFDSFCARC
jgi:hypothetical protein